jgi:hypothetical protein
MSIKNTMIAVLAMVVSQVAMASNMKVTNEVDANNIKQVGYALICNNPAISGQWNWINGKGLFAAQRRDIGTKLTGIYVGYVYNDGTQKYYYANVTQFSYMPTSSYPTGHLSFPMRIKSGGKVEIDYKASQDYNLFPSTATTTFTLDQIAKPDFVR